ncbi:MAG: DNA polymerase III subunit alpha, partial [Opitutaceae bacterium]|nr:DNA polymerase III subunit alpha [Cytophagales bacterium]
MYLNCHSCFSLRYGTLQPEMLVKEAKKRSLTSLVLTDINNTSAHFDFVRACENEGIKAFLGIEFRTKDYKPLYTAIARNNEGLYELNTFLTQHSLDEVQLPETAPEFKNSFVIYRLSWGVPDVLRENEFIGIAPSEITRLYSSPWKMKQEKLLAFCSVTFSEPDDFITHQLLRAIDQNVLLSRLDPAYNADAGEFIHTEEEIRSLYGLYPQLLENTERELRAISLQLDLNSEKNRLYFTGSKEDDYKLLEKLAWEGMKYRYGLKNREAKERVQKELKVIAEQDFICYFLIADDIIRYAHSKGYHHIGRGSGANSIIAYCLKICDVDPLELDLYFERFINKHRSSPPDFDLDFCWNERDDVTDYIFKRFGKEHVALLATYSTFNLASIIRELGKVYGLPKGDIDQIANEPRLTEKHHPLAKEIFFQGQKLQDLPNHLGIHAGGVLITEKPLCNFTALKLMPKGFPIVHFDMHVAEENKFFKFDILSQRGLGHIKDTVSLVLKNKQQYIDIHRVDAFKKDPNIKSKLKAAKTIGCFYIESPAMRGLLSKLSCDSFITLVAASSIIRPGVAKSGMMREYIYRFQNQDKIKYLHPVFEKILGETYGVMVYQEDVIKIAHHFGGLDLAEADILRRTMSGKSRNQKENERIRAQYFSNCKSFGYSDELAMEVWRQIESFAGFSFC